MAESQQQTQSQQAQLQQEQSQQEQMQQTHLQQGQLQQQQQQHVQQQQAHQQQQPYPQQQPQPQQPTFQLYSDPPQIHIQPQPQLNAQSMQVQLQAQSQPQTLQIHPQQQTLHVQQHPQQIHVLPQLQQPYRHQQQSMAAAAAEGASIAVEQQPQPIMATANTLRSAGAPMQQLQVLPGTIQGQAYLPQLSFNHQSQQQQQIMLQNAAAVQAAMHMNQLNIIQQGRAVNSINSSSILSPTSTNLAQVAHLAGTVNCNSSVGSVVSIVTTTGNINNSKSVAPDAKNPVVSNCQPQGQSLTQGNQGQVNQVMGVTPTLVAGKAAMLPQQNGAPLMLRPIANIFSQPSNMAQPFVNQSKGQTLALPVQAQAHLVNSQTPIHLNQQQQHLVTPAAQIIPSQNLWANSALLQAMAAAGYSQQVWSLTNTGHLVPQAVLDPSAAIQGGSHQGVQLAPQSLLTNQGQAGAFLATGQSLYLRPIQAAQPLTNLVAANVQNFSTALRGSGKVQMDAGLQQQTGHQGQQLRLGTLARQGHSQRKTILPSASRSQLTAGKVHSSVSNATIVTLCTTLPAVSRIAIPHGAVAKPKQRHRAPKSSASSNPAWSAHIPTPGSVCGASKVGSIPVILSTAVCGFSAGSTLVLTPVTNVDPDIGTGGGLLTSCLASSNVSLVQTAGTESSETSVDCVVTASDTTAEGCNANTFTSVPLASPITLVSSVADPALSASVSLERPQTPSVTSLCQTQSFDLNVSLSPSLKAKSSSDVCHDETKGRRQISADAMETNAEETEMALDTLAWCAVSIAESNGIDGALSSMDLGSSADGQQAVARSQIVTHVIEGFEIQEGPVPFSVQRSTLLGDYLCTKPSPDLYHKLEDVTEYDSQRPSQTKPITRKKQVLCAKRSNRNGDSNCLAAKVLDVYEFVRSLSGCQEYADEFRQQEIDGQALLLLKEDHLMTAMSIKLGPALKICARINALREEVLNSAAESTVAVVSPPSQ